MSEHEDFTAAAAQAALGRCGRPREVEPALAALTDVLDVPMSAVAQRLELSPMCVWNYLNGKRTPPEPVRHQLQELLRDAAEAQRAAVTSLFSAEAGPAERAARAAVLAAVGEAEKLLAT